MSQSIYTQVIGNAPAQLRAPEVVDRYLPRTRESSMTMAMREHPAVMAAGFDVDVASTNIRIAEGALLPSASIQGSASRSRDNDPTLGTFANDQASIVANVTAPIYDGGQAASQTRQAKEITVQSRLVLDQIRNQARTAAISAWVTNEGAKIAVSASESEVKAATVALQGVQREAAGGQRTTVDVLNSQADLIQAKARLDRSAARPRDRLLHAAQRRRPSRRQDAGAQHAGLSAGGALPPGPRRLARPAHAIGAVTGSAWA